MCQQELSMHFALPAWVETSGSDLTAAATWHDTAVSSTDIVASLNWVKCLHAMHLTLATLAAFLVALRAFM